MTSLRICDRNPEARAPLLPGTGTRLRVGMTEISDNFQSETAPTIEALQAALEFERARTREIDHRAKNSLQLVSSMLLLQSRRSLEPETQKALKAMYQRVSALAAVHRHLLQAGQSDSFDLSRFVHEHAAAVAQARGEGAAVRLDLDRVTLDASQAGPTALIVNELTLNALTHGATAGREPEANVVLRRAGGGFVLTVQDQGPGLPPAAEQAGFGLTMVKLLAQQLSGSVTFEDAHPGLRAVVTAP
jgi:two-component sensor histidine kinase